MRYGENPHQKGAFFGDLSAMFDKLNGKELSYNNLLDVDAAVNLMAEFDETTLYRMTWTKISRFKIMRPLIRQYSLSNIKSRFLVLNADEVPTALSLPLARLVKPNIRFNRNVIQNVRILRQVYINSRKHIRFGKNFKGIR